MKTNTIQVHFGSDIINICKRDGKYHISIPNKEATIQIRNAGIAGLFGPHVYFNTKKLMDQTIKDVYKASDKVANKYFR